MKIIDVEVEGIKGFIADRDLKPHFECTTEEWGILKYGPNKGEYGVVKETTKLYKSVPRKGFYVGYGALLWMNAHSKKINFNLIEKSPKKGPLSPILVPEKIQGSPKFTVNGKDRWYFFEALEVCRDKAYGNIKLPTGSGKTEIQLTLAYNQLNQLGSGFVLVPTLGIKDQFIERAAKYDIRIREYEAGINMSEPSIVIATHHGIVDQLKSKNAAIKAKAKDFLANITWIVVDECHHSSCSSWFTLLMNLPNCIRSHGFSALPIDEEMDSATCFDEMTGEDARVVGVLGPVIYEKSADDLRDFLNLPYLLNLAFKWKDGAVRDQRARNWTQARQAILDHKDRTKYIAMVFDWFIENGYKIATFCNQKSHAKQILKRCENTKTVCWFGGGEAFDNHGMVNVDYIRKSFGEDIRGLILTSHGIEGLDFSNPLNVLLLTDGKKTRQTDQKVGRIVRPDVKPSMVVNLWDLNCNIFPKHARQRSLDIAKEFSCRPIKCMDFSELQETVQAIEENQVIRS